MEDFPAPAKGPSSSVSGADEAAAVGANFRRVAIWFSLGHGSATSLLAVATTVLGMDLANIGNGLLFVATVLSSIFLGAPAVIRFGSKGALVAGMFLAVFYDVGFVVAACFEDMSPKVWVLFAVGSVFGGVSKGIVWTAQGAYFVGAAQQLVAASQDSVSLAASTARLSGQFACIYLLFEVGSKLCFAALESAGCAAWLAGLVFLTGTLLSTAMLRGVHDVPSPSAKADYQPCRMVYAAASLWWEPQLWLLSCMNLTFGFASSFIHGYVSSSLTRVELGAPHVPLLAAVPALTAALLSVCYTNLGMRAGKGVVLVIGSTSFLALPLCVYLAGCCDGWGWGLAVLYVLQGSGRAVYEATNRAIFSDFFSGSETEGAFANCALQSSLSFALGFFLLEGDVTMDLLGAGIVLFSIFGPPCYALALLLKRKKEGVTSWTVVGWPLPSVSFQKPATKKEIEACAKV